MTVSGSDDAVELPEEVKSALGDSRLVSAMRKLRARSVSQHVNRTLRAAEIENINVAAFTNGAPINEWFRPIACAPDAMAGW